MRNLITFSMFIILLMSFISTPAPVNIEIYDFILILTPSLIGMVCLAMIRNYDIYLIEFKLILAIIFYLAYLLMSTLLGLSHGVPLVSIIRSVGPGINFLPLLAIGFLPGSLIKPWTLGLSLILVGLLQAGYHFFLYFTGFTPSGSTLDVLINRITLTDPRTSIPIFLALAILPGALFFNNQQIRKNKVLLVLSIFLILIGLFAGIVTLTRAIILSIFFGWAVFIALFLYFQFCFHPTMLASTIKKLVLYSCLFVLIITCSLNLPAVNMVFAGIMARFYNYSPILVSNDYSNGRLYDEWLPALYTWLNADMVSFFFGVGAGNPFTLLSGEEHAYTHNICIYSLLYGGIYGLFACLWLYFTIFKTLVSRAFETKHTIYLAYAALLSSMFFYVQLFAVYKLLAFNAMLFLIMSLALSRPEIKKVNS